MTNHFEWEAEDGIPLDEEDVHEGYHGERPPRFRRLLLFLVSIVLLTLLVLLMVRQLGQRVASSAEAVEEAVISSHTLVHSAARRGDIELLANVLSDRQLEWTDAQLDLMREGLFYDRRSFGLVWQPSESAVPVETSITPDLQTAEVDSLQSYLVQGDPSERVELQHTSIYRRSRDRWLLSPPSYSFWGEKVSTRGRFLELSVLQRDEIPGLRIAADLEASIGAACALLVDLECQDDTHLEVNLLADPTLLLELESPESRFQGKRYLNLPTPTVVGLPMDELGYRALYRGYAERVLSSLIGDMVDYSCCRRVRFYEALLDAQLFQLGLKRWPLAGDEYRLIAGQVVDMNEIRRLWAQEDDLNENTDMRETALVYAFVEFIIAEAKSSSPANMQRSLSTSATLDDWLVQVNTDRDALDDGWNRFVRAKIDGDGSF
jgi:hypothetical protein